MVKFADYQSFYDSPVGLEFLGDRRASRDVQVTKCGNKHLVGDDDGRGLGFDLSFEPNLRSLTSVEPPLDTS